MTPCINENIFKFQSTVFQLKGKFNGNLNNTIINYVKLMQRKEKYYTDSTPYWIIGIQILTNNAKFYFNFYNLFITYILRKILLGIIR